MSFPSHSTIRASVALLCLLAANALVFAKPVKNSKGAETPKSSATASATASPKVARPPETNVDAKTEAALLQAEDRFVSAIEKRDAKSLDELLHPQFADSIEGGESAVSRRGFIMRLNDGRLPAYRVEKKRELIRSGDSFTVEGLAKDMSRDGWESRAEEWVRVRRLWERQGDRWIATAQIITREVDGESNKDAKEKENK